MTAYAFFIEDDRSSAPTLEFMLVRDAARARQLASERLIASSHHVSVLVHESGKEIFRVSRSRSRGPLAH